jgi:uncharacterized protein (TIGR02246 family)
MRLRVLVPVLALVLASGPLFAQTPQPPEQKTPPAGQKPPEPQTPPAGQKQPEQKAPHAAQKEGMQADTQKLRDEYVAAWSKGDARAVAMLYTENAIFVNAMGQVMAGRQQIQQGFEKDLAGTWKGSKLTVKAGRQQSVKDDVLVEEGTYQVTGGQAPAGAEAKAAQPPGDGRYVLTMVREAGQWRIASHAAFVPQREMGVPKPMQE